MVDMEERGIQDSLTRIVDEIEGAAALPDAPALAHVRSELLSLHERLRAVPIPQIVEGHLP